jgi:predicted RNase H-like HicB family nuclease
VEFDQETNHFVGIIPGVPGAHTHAETLDELQRNLREVLELCLEENAGLYDRNIRVSESEFFDDA